MPNCSFYIINWKHLYTDVYSDCHMYKELSILELFFEDPLGNFHIREIARITKLNHMTIRKYLNQFVIEGFLKKNKTKLYDTYSGNHQHKKFLHLKLYYNLELLRKSNIIEALNNFYDYPTIVLFGSYASATNMKNSDIDICVITNIKKEFTTEVYKKILNRKVSLHLFGESEFKNMKNKNKELLNNICNGIKLSGKLEVV